jgi:hypothetical protein
MPTYYVERVNHPGTFNALGRALAISPSGSITGDYITQTSPSSVSGSGFTLIGGIYTTMPSPGDIPGKPGTSDVPTPRDINDSGAVVGYTLSGGLGFIYANGTYQFLTMPGGASVEPSKINASGQVAGDAPGNAFLYSAGTMTIIDAGTGLQTRALDLDNSGRVLVKAINGSGVEGVYLYDGSSTNRLGSFGSAAFNSAGEIAAASGNQLTIFSTTGGEESFTAGNFTSISVLGFNALGEVIGSYSSPSQSGGYFLFADGEFSDFRNLFAPGQYPTGSRYLLTDINDAGEISGSISLNASSGFNQAAIFTTTPVPEPGVPALLIGGACVVLAAGLRSRGIRTNS